MKYRVGYRARAVVLVIFLILAALLFLVRVPFLIVSGQANYPVLELPIISKTFSLYYMHSVHKTPVWENFYLDPGDQMVLTSTCYQSLGVGIPFWPGEGELVNDGSRFVLKGLDRHFSEINLIAVPIARQALIYRDKQYDFNYYFGSGDPITIRVSRCRPGVFLWRRFVHGRETA